MLRQLKDNVRDNSTDYEVMTQEEQTLIVKTVRDTGRVDLETILKIDVDA